MNRSSPNNWINYTTQVHSHHVWRFAEIFEGTRLYTLSHISSSFLLCNVTERDSKKVNSCILILYSPLATVSHDHLLFGLFNLIYKSNYFTGFLSCIPATHSFSKEYDYSYNCSIMALLMVQSTKSSSSLLTEDFDALSITWLTLSLSGQVDLLHQSFPQFQHLVFESLFSFKEFLLFGFLVPSVPWFSGHSGESDLCQYSPHLQYVPLNWTLNPAAKAFSLRSFLFSLR